MEKEIILAPGESCSKNYNLGREITTFDDLFEVMQTEKSLFHRHRPYPTAFFWSQHFRTIYHSLNNGWFWTITPKEKG